MFIRDISICSNQSNPDENVCVQIVKEADLVEKHIQFVRGLVVIEIFHGMIILPRALLNNANKPNNSWLYREIIAISIVEQNRSHLHRSRPLQLLSISLFLKLQLVIDRRVISKCGQNAQLGDFLLLLFGCSFMLLIITEV
jgi:hypothetical protein